MTNSGWTSQPTPPPAPQPGALSVETQHVLATCGNVDAVLMAWREAKDLLDKCKNSEMIFRRAVFELKFPTPTEGTQRTPLGNGWNIKAVFGYNYKLANKQDETEKALEAMAKIGPKAEFVADRLVKWSPEMSVSEYREVVAAAAAGDADMIALKALLDSVLTITPAAPSLEIEEPKAGK